MPLLNEERPKKYWLRSKTVWTGIVAIITGLATAVTAVLPLLGVMQSVLAPQYYLVLVASLSGLSSILGATAIWARGQVEDQIRFHREPHTHEHTHEETGVTHTHEHSHEEPFNGPS